MPLSVLLLYAAGCTAENVSIGEALTCTATLSEAVTTVVTLDWTAPSDSSSYVEFGDSESYSLTTPDSSGTEASFDLAGVPGDSDLYWHGVSTTADGTSECSGVTRTGSIPSDVPTVTVTTDDDGQDDSPFVIGAFFAGAGSNVKTQLAAYRRDGAIVWYYDGDDGATGMDLHFPHDGNGLLFNEFVGHMGGDEGSIQRISLAGEVLASYDAPLAHHMFCELPDGTLTYQAIDTQSYSDGGTAQDWVGDALVEIPPDGTGTKVFSVWDALTPRRNDRDQRGSIYPGLDWTHGNMISYYPDSDQYLLSLGHADDLLFIDRATMEVQTIYGVDGVEASPPFDYQHDATVLDDGNLLMFMTDDSGSGAIEYAPDGDGLTEVWRSDFGQSPFALGQAQRLANGNTFVNAGAGGSLSEVTPDGTVVWEMRLADHGIFAQFQPVPDLYTGH